MFRLNQKKICDIEKRINQKSKEHEINRSLSRNRYRQVQKDINNSKESKFKKRVRDKLSSY